MRNFGLICYLEVGKNFEKLCRICEKVLGNFVLLYLLYSWI